jgi:hypothetical protein
VRVEVDAHRAPGARDHQREHLLSAVSELFQNSLRNGINRLCLRAKQIPQVDENRNVKIERM